MRYGWLFVIPVLGLVIIVAIAVIRFKLEKPRKIDKLAVLAHTEPIKNLPEYKNAQKQYNRLMVTAASLFVFAILFATILAARPTQTKYSDPNYGNHDIMLCLDVSGTLSAQDKEIIDQFKNTILKSNGQQVGLTIFSNTSLLISPLSNDYDAAAEVFNDLSTNYTSYANVVSANNGTAKIGDSLVGCINNIDQLGTDGHEQTVILATKEANETAQNASIMQAAKYAKRYGVVVYNINLAEDTDANQQNQMTDAQQAELRSASLATGGSYYVVTKEAATSISDAIGQIMRQESARSEGAPKLTQSDAPSIVAICLAIMVIALIIVVWRLKIWFSIQLFLQIFSLFLPLS